MNKTPSSHNTELPEADTPLTETELERYRELIHTIRPHSHSVKGNVMKAIQAERKAARLRRIVRYGSIAASFVLIMGVLITMSPILNGTQKSAEAEDVFAYALTADRSISDKSITAGKADNGAMPECEAIAPTSADPADEDCSTEISKACSASLEDSVESVTADSIVFSLPCGYHPDGMHTFPTLLINHVGEDAFNQWYNSPDALDDCGTPTLRTFVLTFGITADQLKELGASIGIDFPIEEIYGNNE